MLSRDSRSTQTLIALYPSDDGNRSVSDVEAIVVACTKSLEHADQETRRSLGRLVGHILASTQTPKAAPPPDASTKKGKKDQDDEDDIAPAPALNVDESVKTIMTPIEMFNQITLQFTKPGAMRKTRIGLFDFYAALLTTLGPAFVETNYAIIVKHFFQDVILHPRSSVTRYETLLVRKLVGILLRDLIGVRLLSERGQIGAIRELSSSYLKKWPALMPSQTAPNPLVLVIALREVSGLVQQLGNAPPPVQVRTLGLVIL